MTHDTYAAGIEVMQMAAYVRDRSVELSDPDSTTIPPVSSGCSIGATRSTPFAGCGRTIGRHLLSFGQGEWRGQKRRTLIDYDSGAAGGA